MTKDPDSALLSLLQSLDACGYDFVTPTPASHARVLARPDKQRARDVRDILGWSLAFDPGIAPSVTDLLRQANMIETVEGGLLKSWLRVSKLHRRLFLHSAYPTEAQDAVFFGPDSYRFADLIAAELAHYPLPAGAHIVDIGAGAGVGGIIARLASGDARVTLTDVNPNALRLARINAAAAGVTVETIADRGLAGVSGPIDLAVINPPYIIDDANRAYRDGGGMHGGEAALEMTRLSAGRLAPGGRVILYTGAAIVQGRNALYEAIADIAKAHDLDHSCRELDPDVFGEELEKPAYQDVERIALIAVKLRRRD